MKITQYLEISNKKQNKEFQKELWDKIWSNATMEDLANQIARNPIYWRLNNLLRKEDEILEAGCGFGHWVWKLHNLGYKVIGVDNAKTTIQRIRREFPSLNIKLADVEKLPFNDETFDVYLSFGVIEHFPKGPKKVLSEAHRVLKKKGLLYLTVPYLNLLRFLKYSIQNPKKGKFYQYLYSKNEVVKMIESNGFEVSKVSYYDFASAIKREIPFSARILQKITSRRNNKVVKKINRMIKEREPNFIFQKLLYRIQSYLILVEGYKK